jgi:hypothetical protein
MALILTPAYGRDYTSKSKVLEDFGLDKDFISNDMGSRWCGKPINRSQVEEMGTTEVNIRYRSLRRTCVLRKKGNTWKAE